MKFLGGLFFSMYRIMSKKYLSWFLELSGLQFKILNLNKPNHSLNNQSSMRHRFAHQYVKSISLKLGALLHSISLLIEMIDWAFQIHSVLTPKLQNLWMLGRLRCHWVNHWCLNFVLKQAAWLKYCLSKMRKFIMI